MKHTRTLRTAGWLAVAALLSAALIAPSGTLAQDGNQTNVPFDFKASDCTGAPGGGNFTPGAGQVVWVFVHSGVTGPGTLTAKFDVAGTKTADSYVQGGIKYAITTGQDTLLSFSDTIDGGVLTLSHTCYTATTTTSSTASTTSTTASTTSTVSSETTASTTSTVSSETTASTTATSTTATGTVSEQTGANPTPPATDTISSGGSGSSPDGWRIVLFGMAGLLGATLLLTPVALRKR